MDFTEYQAQTRNLAVYPGQGSNDGLLYSVLGVAAKAGAVSDRVRSLMRDGISQEVQDEMIAELGEVLRAVTTVCTELDISLGSVAEVNLDTLNKRFAAGTIRDQD